MEQTISGLSGETYRILPVTIGGVSKGELLALAQKVRRLVPFVEGMMRSTQFTVRPVCIELMQIVLSPRQLGFETAPDTLAELFDPALLFAWSVAHLAGHTITINPAEVGPHLAIQYQDQPRDEMLMVAMEPVVWSSLKYQAIFGVACDSQGKLVLRGDWLESDQGIPLDLPFAFSLKERSR